MKEKILPVASLPINCYPDYAYPLSIILNFDSGWNWLYCNFIQLYYDNKELTNPLRFYYTDSSCRIWNSKNPLLNYQSINRDLFFKFNKNIIEFLIDAIDADNYVTLFIDEYYIPNRAAYGIKHYYHILFLYGYDQEKKFFYTAGYNQRYQYEHQKITYEELTDAFLNFPTQYWDDDNLICLIQYNQKGTKYELDIDCIIEQLEDYLYSENSSCRYKTFFNTRNLYFGYDIYPQLKTYYTALHENGWSWNFRKPLYLLHEHKKIMTERILFLEKKGILNNSRAYSDFFIDSAADLLNHIVYLIKYQKQRKNKYIDIVLTLIDSITTREAKIIKALIEELKHYRFTKENEENEYCSCPKIGAAIKPLGKTYYGNIQVEIDLVTTSDRINGIIGFTDGQSNVNMLDAIPVQLRMNNAGYFDAVNKNQYSSIDWIKYSINDEYHIRFKIDLKKQIYSVDLSNSKGEWGKISENFSFALNSSVIENIGRIIVYADSIEKIIIHRITVNQC